MEEKKMKCFNIQERLNFLKFKLLDFENHKLEELKNPTLDYVLSMVCMKNEISELLSLLMEFIIKIPITCQCLNTLSDPLLKIINTLDSMFTTYPKAIGNDINEADAMNVFNQAYNDSIVFYAKCMKLFKECSNQHTRIWIK